MCVLSQKYWCTCAYLHNFYRAAPWPQPPSPWGVGGCKPSHHHHSPYPNPRLHTGAWFKLKGRWHKEKWRWRPLPYSTPHLTCVSLEGVGHTSGEGWCVGDVVWWWVVANTCLHTQRHYTLLDKEVPPHIPTHPGPAALGERQAPPLRDVRLVVGIAIP